MGTRAVVVAAEAVSDVLKEKGTLEKIGEVMHWYPVLRCQFIRLVAEGSFAEVSEFELQIVYSYIVAGNDVQRDFLHRKAHSCAERYDLGDFFREIIEEAYPVNIAN